MLDKLLPEICGFERARAFELLKLTQEAHDRYNDLYPSPKKNKNTGKSSPKKKFDHITSASKEWINHEWEMDITQPIKIDSTIEIEIDGQPKSINCLEYKEMTSSPYQVLAHLVFTQTVWSITDIGNTFKRRNLFGFIARHSKTSDIYVVFRGTSNLGEWISNIKLIQQSHTTVRNLDIKEGETHWGFRRTYERPEVSNSENKVLWVTHWFDNCLLSGVSSMRETVEKTLVSACPKTGPKVKIFVTGHSLGGALATLATAHINKMVNDGKISADPPILYSFASPRVGDTNFAKAFDEIECYRVTNSEDLVPKIPLPTLLPVAGRLPARNGLLNMTARYLQYLDNKLDFQHVGVPLYFTSQKGNIAGNHTLPVYFESLIPSTLI